MTGSTQDLIDTLRDAAEQALSKDAHDLLVHAARVIADLSAEHCQACGQPYAYIWAAPGDDLWERVTGRTDGSGLLCIRCFDNLARSVGIVLHWTCSEGDWPAGWGR